MPLTDTAIKRLKPSATATKHFDEKGLFLFVTPSGGKLWRLKYRFGGKEKLLALGSYPETALSRARQKRDDARSLIQDGIDPSEQRKAEKIANADANSFEVIAREWHAKRAKAQSGKEAKWTQKHADRIMARLENDVFPWIGKKPATQITAPELLTILHRIEARGAIETAHRAHRDCSQVFRYAIATGRAERDPAADLRGALTPIVVKHHASITEPQAIGRLLRDIRAYEGSFVTRCALRLSPYVFARPSELRCAEWSEFSLDAREWRIPAHRMKMRSPHIVPLSRQAVTVLRELEPLTGQGRYLFPSVRSDDRPMSDNTVNSALRRLGYTRDEMTGHGFRSMASTILNEQGWNRDAIERQLAHMERDKVRGAYNYAEYLPERRKMMQAWADYLDSLEHDGNATPLGRAA